MKYIQFQINTPTKKEADVIVDVLFKKHLIAGTSEMPAFSRYWWKGKIEKEKYYIIYGFTLAKHKKKIITETKKYHSDEVPGIVFWEIDANKDFLEWIKENTKN